MMRENDNRDDPGDDLDVTLDEVKFPDPEDLRPSGASSNQIHRPDPTKPLPITVAMRLKPNTNNHPIGLQGNPTKKTVQLDRAQLGQESSTESFDFVFSESSSQVCAIAVNLFF